MIGYSSSILFTVIASTVMISGTGCGANGDYDLKNGFLVNPTFPYAHAMFYLCDKCSWD